ncbi:enoyl-CoA hydratase/isomerase family protein [Coralliovum pocilloporae]|uniref:enoyl-CoA hydratase/isomerase family protein n=1 Tax=Coralliovum pocilloporae TaxID=3066369 RepID=UPI003307825D
MSSDDILFEQRGCAGLVTLNRPKALNALSHDMVLRLSDQLRNWETNSSVAHIVVRSTSERAFSAGGDIRDLYESGRAGKPPLDFFRDEYRLNAYIHHYPKPYISLIDGIVMGGGVGVSVNGSHRIGGDNVGFAMPEVGIGFFPDVGGSYFLPRLKGSCGVYLALTGDRLKQGDALWAGVLTHTVPSHRFEVLLEALVESPDTDAVLAAHEESVPADRIGALADALDAHFRADNLETVMSRLDKAALNGDEWCGQTAATIRLKSPTSLHIAFRQMQEGLALDFRAAMQMEYRIVSRLLSGQEFYEGIRAAIIDKDNNPRWSPERLDLVSSRDIDAYFAELGDDELTFDR